MVTPDPILKVSAGSRKTSRCQSSSEYDLPLPIDTENDLSRYEMDKKRVAFDSARATAGANFDDDSSDSHDKARADLVATMSRTKLTTDGPEPNVSTSDLAQATSMYGSKRRKQYMGASKGHQFERNTNSLSPTDVVNQYAYETSPDGMTVTLCRWLQEARRRTPSKNVAPLLRGEQFATIPATSGWLTDTLPFDEPSRPGWFDRGFDLASLTGHKFADVPGWDRDRSEQYYASHAEKKLIAYFLDYHISMSVYKPCIEKIEREFQELPLGSNCEMKETRRMQKRDKAWLSSIYLTAHHYIR